MDLSCRLLKVPLVCPRVSDGWANGRLSTSIHWSGHPSLTCVTHQVILPSTQSAFCSFSLELAWLKARPTHVFLSQTVWDFTLGKHCCFKGAEQHRAAILELLLAKHLSPMIVKYPSHAFVLSVNRQTKKSICWVTFHFRSAPSLPPICDQGAAPRGLLNFTHWLH